MLELDRKLEQALAPYLARVLIVDHKAAAAAVLRQLLPSVRDGQSWVATTTSAGLKMAEQYNPRLIFVEFDGPDLDGIAFTKALRRSHLPCRQAPVIMVTGQATPAAILSARQAGVHEFLRKPFTNKDLVRRLEAVLRPRTWIEGVGYVGPDRRRFNSGDYKGARKRRTDESHDTAAATITQALQIVAAAVHAVEIDPQQAFRSLSVQAADLRRAAQIEGRADLGVAASALQAYLEEIRTSQKLTRAGVARVCEALLAFLPKEQADRAKPREVALL